MNIIFNINYHTAPGEALYLTGNIPALGNGDYSKALKMNFIGDGWWSAVLCLSAQTTAFEYRYAVIADNGYKRDEWGHGNKFVAAPDVDVYRIVDHWQDMPLDKPLYSSAFTNCICRHSRLDEHISYRKGFITISVAAPMIGEGRALAICGNAEVLGKWNTADAVVMSNNEFPLWKAYIPAKGIDQNSEYKFIIINKDSGNLIAWEDGQNRKVELTPAGDEASAIAGLRLNYPLEAWRGAGTAIPVFSLRSEKDCGVGDFFDIISLIDWAADTGQRVLQLLPINDTTLSHSWTDSYPYNANSTVALHPMYLRLDEIGSLNDDARRRYYRDLANELNALPDVDYVRVNNAKTEFFKEIFAQDGKKTLRRADYKSFVKNNSHWLLPYAAFCVLRDTFNTPDFNRWGQYANFSADILDKVLAKHKHDIDYVCFLQYHLDRQMRHVHDYARKKGIVLKGDIPIGISPTGADAWQDSRLFNMDCQAGAPPDDFSVLGQNWGFPTYNWAEMAKDGYARWKARFKKMAEYFDAYRIDHVLGFFRIWQIPINAIHGLLGFFNPALPFSVDELRGVYNFNFNADFHATPYITKDIVGEVFGNLSHEVCASFLDNLCDGRYRLKCDFDTQRKVQQYFEGLAKSDKNASLCEGLINLIDDVLFIEDPVEKGKYHPRIAAQTTHIYRYLSDDERNIFNKLYSDFFYQRHNDFWKENALAKLPSLIDSTDMLVCAEDLGMIPACVGPVLQQLEILTLEVQRMPKEAFASFGDTSRYPYLSVCTTSTHDMPGIRQWWEDNRNLSQKYYNEVLNKRGDAPYIADYRTCSNIVDLHLQSPSMLCILPLQDWLATDEIRRDNPRLEQINEPANPNHYWRYRMHISIEELQQKHSFNKLIYNKIKKSGRLL